MDASSPDWPSFVFHWNGHERVVANQEEYDALPPGYSKAPIPDTRAMGLPWNQRCGPLGPGTQERRPRGEMCMVALRGLIYNFWARVPGEKFLLEGRGEDRGLRESGAIAESSLVANRLYLTNGRWFEDEIAQERYVQCYERDDIAALGFFETPQDTASTPDPVVPSTQHAVPPRRKGRHPYLSDEELVREYRRVYEEQTALQGSHASLPTVARNIMPPYKPDSLRHRLRKLGIHHPSR